METYRNSKDKHPAENYSSEIRKRIALMEVDMNRQSSARRFVISWWVRNPARCANMMAKAVRISQPGEQGETTYQRVVVEFADGSKAIETSPGYWRVYRG